MKDKDSKNVSIFVLAASTDFAVNELATKLPKALWPVADKPALEMLITSLKEQGLNDITVCSKGISDIFRKHLSAETRESVKFIGDKLPSGTAGAVRDAGKLKKNSIIFVMPANIIQSPSICELVKKHIKSGCEMTALFNPSLANHNGSRRGNPANMYICNSSVLEYIPEEGYFDIKESLIPKMLRSGENINSVTLKNNIGHFNNRQEYLSAIGNYLGNSSNLNLQLKLLANDESKTVWVGTNTKVNPSARIYGPVVIMDGACICKNALIIGPTVVGRNSRVEEDSVVAESVLWDDAQVNQNSEVRECIIAYSSCVSANTISEEKSIIFKSQGLLSAVFHTGLMVVRDTVYKLQSVLEKPINKIDEKRLAWIRYNLLKWAPWFGGALVFIAFLWSYWPNLLTLWGIWQRSDEYSVGMLVPFLAVYILWSRRDDISKCPIRPSITLGILAFIIAQGFRIFGIYFMYGSAIRFSIGVSIAALALLLFGWQLFKKVFTVLLFLFLMLPWPHRIEAAVAQPLQRWAASSALFCLEVLGYGATREGNIIHIGDTSVAIAEACNGLRMITAFLVICALVVFVVKRDWWEKLIVLVSALPIALLCNTLRLTITAIAFTTLDAARWQDVFHDFGGYAMMPLALLIIIGELWFLANLVRLPDKPEPAIVTQ